MMLHVGSWAITLVIWALSGLAAFAGSLCFAELATIFPQQGGTNIFIKEGLGGLPSFIYTYIQSGALVLLNLFPNFYFVHLLRILLNCLCLWLSATPAEHKPYA